MISTLLMASRYLSGFENDQIVVYNVHKLSLYDIAKKFNCYHSSNGCFPLKCIAQSGGAVEYTDCFSAEG